MCLSIGRGTEKAGAIETEEVGGNLVVEAKQKESFKKIRVVSTVPRTVREKAQTEKDH